MLRSSLIRRGARAGRGPATRIGRYELLYPLGVGGMAEVFKARVIGSAGFMRDVVIKRILPGHGHDPEFVSMFVDEAKLLGMLHHPAIAQAYDFGEDDGVLYLALEYVDGPSLSRVLRTLRGANRAMPPAIAAYIAREICRALDYVHGFEDAQGVPLGIVHRDVTPSNVMLTATGGVKLLDFGVAKSVTCTKLTKDGTVKGKPAYLAPEQLEGKKIDGRVDLFALGIMMHEMLSLEHLFAGDSDLGTVKKIMEMKIPAPSVKRAEVPAELDRIVMRALERDRDRRYATAAELARDLEDFVIASRLRVDEVASFVREIVREEPAPAAAAPAPPVAAAAAPGRAPATERDLGLAWRMWSLGHLGGRSPGAVAAGVAGLALLALATALGMHSSSPAPHKQPPTPSVARAAGTPHAIGGGRAAAAER